MVGGAVLHGRNFYGGVSHERGGIFHGGGAR